MHLFVGDRGDFQKKLEAMEAAGHVDDREIGILKPMIDAAVLRRIGDGSPTLTYDGLEHLHSKANELCPSGYTTLSEDAGFNRKEMRNSCPGQNTKPP
jgi:hypothetical protein